MMHDQLKWGCGWRKLLPLLLLAVISGCGDQKSDSGGGKMGGGSTSSTAGKKRILMLTNGDDPFWDAMRKGMEKAAADMKIADEGFAAVLDKGDFSEEAQISKLQQYATQTDIAAVAISPTNRSNRGIADALKALQKRGVKVLCIDSDMDVSKYRDARFAYLGTNNTYAGEQLGRAAKALRPDGASYATFSGLKSAANVVERTGGFATGAGDKFKQVDDLEDKADENTNQTNVKTVLNNHPETSVLVGIWAYNAHNIVQVVKERNVRDKTTVVVFDAAPLALKDLEEGQIDAMVVQNPYQMGYEGVKLMKALVQEDHKVIKGMFPDYDEKTGKIEQKSPGSDVYETEVRVVVPDDKSPVKADLLDAKTKFFLLKNFKDWLKERNLTGS